MSWEVIGIVALPVWLASVFAAFWKKRWRAGLAGVAAPLVAFVAFVVGLVICLSGSGDCSTENAVLSWVFVFAVGLVVWVVAAAAIPRDGTREEYPDWVHSPRGPPTPSFDRVAATWGLAAAGLFGIVGLWARQTGPSYTDWTAPTYVLGLTCSVVCIVGLVYVTARHRISYKEGRGQWLILLAWVIAAVALVFAASSYSTLWFVENTLLIEDSAPWVALALAAACVGLLRDTDTSSTSVTRTLTSQ